MDTPIIAVLGGARCSEEIAQLAERVGAEIARRGGILICGGLFGVMEAACRGAKKHGGTTIGVLPGVDRNDANPYVDIPIVTGLADARNVIIVRTAHAAIAVDGEYGTLSEIAFCLKLGTPVVGLKTWELAAPVVKAQDPEEAVSKAFELATQKWKSEYD